MFEQRIIFRVMVMSNGAVAEFDKPETLLEDMLSLFYSLAKDTDVVE